MVVKLGRALTAVITHLLHYLQVCNTHFVEVVAACNVPCKTQNAKRYGIHFRAMGERRVAAFFSASYAMQKKISRCHSFLSHSSSHRVVPFNLSLSQLNAKGWVEFACKTAHELSLVTLFTEGIWEIMRIPT